MQPIIGRVFAKAENRYPDQQVGSGNLHIHRRSSSPTKPADLCAHGSRMAAVGIPGALWGVSAQV